MPSKTVKYWLKTDFERFEPLACSRVELRQQMQLKELEWCTCCQAAVRPVSDLDATGLNNVCPWCGVETVLY